jgi:aminoglycoside phosphotransferase (APT) family kinase protein
VQAEEIEAVVVLKRAGLIHQGVLGSGSEGTVADLGDGTVAKVWSGRSLSDLGLLRDFYDALHVARPIGLAVAMPHILDLREVDGTFITIEERLTGDPVWRADGTSPALTAGVIDTMIEALAALAAVPGEPTLRALPMLPNEPPLAPDAPFEAELAGLVARRADRFESALRAALPDIETVVTATVTALRGLPPATPSLLHGDLMAANVLASGGHATAVLDFGSLSTTGDPAFDAAITASCFDMWGPSAPDVEGELDRAFVPAFGHDHDRYSVYRAAYALTTACCFGTDLSEGHFAWCMTMLNRADVRDAIQA